MCARVRQLLGRQGDLVTLDCPRDAERQAQHIAAQLLVHAPAREAEPPDLYAVDANSLALVRPRSVGVEAFGLWAMEQLGLDFALEHLGLGPKATRAEPSLRVIYQAPGADPAPGGIRKMAV